MLRRLMLECEGEMVQSEHGCIASVDYRSGPRSVEVMSS